MSENNNKEYDPYLSARREWDERYGSYISAARWWRLAGVLSLLIALASVGGVVYFAGKPKMIPYVVEVDGKGETVGVYAAGRSADPRVDDQVLRWQLSQWIKNFRAVSPDTTVQREKITQVYALLSAAYPAAQQAVSEWYRDNSPLKRAADETVSVVISQILPVSDQTWRVEWEEVRRARSGLLIDKTDMTGTVSVITGGEVTENNLLLNPTGIYVKHFEWQKQLVNE
jgi:type IV secretion system protein VirB5